MLAKKLLESMPNLRGVLRENVILAKTNWFQVGGPAEVLFKPQDTEDLSYFLKNIDKSIPITVLGVGSNVLVRDGGVDGVVIKLGREFNYVSLENNEIEVGAACLDSNLANFAAENAITGLEFFVGIPGTVGGAVQMNAGCYGTETKDILIRAEAVNMKGEIVILENADFNFKYRGHNLSEDYIFTKAFFKVQYGEKQQIQAKMNEISEKRAKTQPIKTKTSGSTFKNPPEHQAWELIDQAGLRGFKINNAAVSELHCNFLINLGGCTAQDLEDLGEEIITRVYNQSGIRLEWEIKRIGKKIT